jgi:predicted MFS family arabinose efflux permease
MSIALITGAKLAPILLHHTSERRALLWCHTVTAVGIVGTVASYTLPPALVFFLAHEVGRGAFQPIKEAYLHDAIASKERATISSFESVSHHLGGAVGLVASGVLAQYGSIPLAWMLSGMMLFVCIAIFWKNGK